MTQPRQTLVFGPYRLPSDVDLLYRGDEVVPLEPRVARVLRYLAERPGRVVSKAELLDNVWSEVFTGDAVLKRAISQVRRALGDDADDARFIRTHHGRGYCFVAEVAASGPSHGENGPATPATPAAPVLPQEITSFVGREHEVAAVRELLSTARLVTIAGAGGMGKTRLAMRIAATMQHEIPDGVWLVELAALADAGLVPATVAQALGVRERPDQPLLAAIGETLRPLGALLVFDTCEHVLAACASLVESLLRLCPRLKVLATSREALEVPGETVWRLSPLALPALEPSPGVDEVARCEAARLFLDRARSCRPDFALTGRNADTVARLCHQLEGIPLAIELAAARVKVFTVEQILSKTADRFQLLVGGGRTASARQQTLRATLDWSYELLTGEERALLGRLSVFAGGWTSDAAEAVCAGVGVEAHAVVDLLTRLADKSLVIVDVGGAEARYRMLKTIRDYARERLVESAEDEQFMASHRTWCVRLAEEAEAALTGADQGQWLDRLEAEHDNLRAALRRGVRDADDAESAQRICGALRQFWYVRGHLGEGRGWLGEALAADADTAPSVRAKALFAAGFLAVGQRDHESGLALYKESLALRRELGDKRGVAETLKTLGDLAVFLGDYQQGNAAMDESLVLSRELDDRRGIASNFFHVGLLMANRGDFDRAASWYEESLAEFRALHDEQRIGVVLNNLARLAHRRGDLDRAEALLGESLGIARELGFRPLVGLSACASGDVAASRGDHARAAALHGEAAVVFRDIGDRWGLSDALEGIAAAAAALGHFLEAARLSGAAAGLRERVGLSRAPAEQAELDGRLEALRRSQGAEDVERAYERGRAMTAEKALADALAFVENPGGAE